MSAGVTMGRVAITGASGFIGRELCTSLRAARHEVIALQRGEKHVDALRWALGDELPEDCRTADMIVHLASATLKSARSQVAAAMDLDLNGTRIILDQSRSWRRVGIQQRFVLMSSQSSSPDAVNAYGRMKWNCESLLVQDDEVAIRPGLVYGDPPESVYAMFYGLSRLPVMPNIRTQPCVQPINVRELARCILKVLDLDALPKVLKLGSVRPLTFGDAVVATAKRAGRRGPIRLSVPLRPAQFAADLLDRVTGSTFLERLNGVIGLQPMDTGPSLAVLGQTLAPF